MPHNHETEKSEGHGKEKPRRPSYLEARRYQDPDEAARVYLQSQEAVRRDSGRADLSVYRLMVGPQLEPHVVVLGDTPNARLFDQLQRFLQTGETVALEEDVLEHLMERRTQAQHLSPWVEGHYRPGQPVHLPKRRR
jgi:hypothetical protein